MNTMKGKGTFMVKLKRILITIITPLVLLASVMVSSINANAATVYSSRYAWRDDAGNIIFRALDKKASSDRTYLTLGYTITRCVLGTQEPIDDQYFTYRCDNPFFNETGVGGGLITTDYVLSETEFLSNVQATNGAWLEDIESGETCWIKIDAIMCVVNGATQYLAQRYSGALNSTTNQDYVSNLLHEHPGVWDKFTKENLVNNTYGWADGKKIYNHYDIYICYNGGEKIEPEIPPIDETLKQSEMEPQYYTWNSNDLEVA